MCRSSEVLREAPTSRRIREPPISRVSPKEICPRIRILVQASVVSRWARVISLKSEEGRSPLQSFLPGALVAQSHSMAMILSYSRILRDFSFICEIPPQTVLH